MSDLEYIKRKASKYNLKADYLNKETLKLYSPKFYFDSWLIKINEEGEIELWHMSKKNNLKKCSYHLQAVVSSKNKIRALQKINSHNKYVAFHKNKNKINLVDRVLAKEEKRLANR